jgi:hypothetical protein
MNFAQTKQIAQTFGAKAAVHDLAYRAVNHVANLMVLKGVVITAADLESPEVENDDDGSWGFLSRETLLDHVPMQESGMTAEFVNEAFSQHDRCYGFMDGGTLASYGWYSTRPTAITPGLTLHFDPEYVYMYSGFTLPAYRGQRLHAIGMTRALKFVTEEGKKGLISYVNSNNFASLRSCYRMGYRHIGDVAILEVGGRRWIHATEGCLRYDFRVEAVCNGQGEDSSVARGAADM